tara:strand:+ start:7855 stop:8868 length:1014 start_codon:yes stop_codon:yes gene_type:complete
MNSKSIILSIIILVLFLGDFDRQKSLFKNIFTNGIHIYGLEVQKKCLRNKVDNSCLEESLKIKDELINYINNLNVNSKFKYDDINLKLLKKNEIKENLRYYGLTDKLIKNHNLEYFEKYKILGFPTILKKYTRYLFFKENNIAYMHKNFEDSFENIDAIYIAEVPMKSFLKLYLQKRSGIFIIVLILFISLNYLSKNINTIKKNSLNNIPITLFIFINLQFLLIRIFNQLNLNFYSIPKDNYFFWVHDKVNDKYNELILFLFMLLISFFLIILNIRFDIVQHIDSSKRKTLISILFLISCFSCFRIANDAQFITYELVPYAIFIYILINLYKRKLEN